MCQSGGWLGRDEAAQQRVVRGTDRLEYALKDDGPVYGQAVAQGGQQAGKAR
ncbi:hypothetical protein GCM10010244_03940 [Streptomyces coeruleorubidus]|nr:hypothetical protein GCM10010244_03940 [Streptomyces bellus]